jgi:hypothetical protein
MGIVKKENKEKKAVFITSFLTWAEAVKCRKERVNLMRYARQKASALKVLILAFSLMASGSITAQSKCQIQGCKAVVGVTKSGWCVRHNPSATHCQGKTKKGDSCKQIVKKADNFCRFHK